MVLFQFIHKIFGEKIGKNKIEIIKLDKIKSFIFLN